MARSTTRVAPHWPSLEEQLSALKVQRGSALEQSIKDNQDFGHSVAKRGPRRTLPFRRGSGCGGERSIPN